MCAAAGLHVASRIVLAPAQGFKKISVSAGRLPVRGWSGTGWSGTSWSRSSRMAAAGKRPFVVAIDGPAASGKGTIAKRLASELCLAHLDTGLLYRGVGWAAVQAQIDLADEQALAELAAGLNLTELAGNIQLRGDEAATAASKVSALPAVRAALLQAQRRFASEPHEGCQGAVLDGRDVGTVICPNAAVKLFVTADVAVRAQRRLDELIYQGAVHTTFDGVLADMQARDERDTQRATAPLKPADDALVLDTTSMSIDKAYHKALDAVKAARAKLVQPSTSTG